MSWCGNTWVSNACVWGDWCWIVHYIIHRESNCSHLSNTLHKGMTNGTHPRARLDSNYLTHTLAGYAILNIVLPCCSAVLLFMDTDLTTVWSLHYRGHLHTWDTLCNIQDQRYEEQAQPVQGWHKCAGKSPIWCLSFDGRGSFLDGYCRGNVKGTQKVHEIDVAAHWLEWRQRWRRGGCRGAQQVCARLAGMDL